MLVNNNTAECGLWNIMFLKKLKQIRWLTNQCISFSTSTKCKSQGKNIFGSVGYHCRDIRRP